MNRKITSLAAGLSLMAGVGVVGAGEPMQLSAKQMDHVAAGTGSYCDLCIHKEIFIFDYKKFYVDPDVDGNSAVAEGEAMAYGDETTAQSFTFTYTDYYESYADATSISVTD